MIYFLGFLIAVLIGVIVYLIYKCVSYCSAISLLLNTYFKKMVSLENSARDATAHIGFNASEIKRLEKKIAFLDLCQDSVKKKRKKGNKEGKICLIQQ